MRNSRNEALQLLHSSFFKVCEIKLRSSNRLLVFNAYHGICEGQGLLATSVFDYELAEVIKNEQIRFRKIVLVYSM